MDVKYLFTGVVMLIIGTVLATLDLNRIGEIHRREREVSYLVILKEVLWGNMGVAIPLLFVGFLLLFHSVGMI